MLPLEMLPSAMLRSEMPPPEMPAAQSSSRRQKLPLSPPLLKRGESLKRMDRPRRPSSSEMLVRLGKALVHRGAAAAQEGRPRADAGSSVNKPFQEIAAVALLWREAVGGRVGSKRSAVAACSLLLMLLPPLWSRRCQLPCRAAPWRWRQEQRDAPRCRGRVGGVEVVSSAATAAVARPLAPLPLARLPALPPAR